MKKLLCAMLVFLLASLVSGCYSIPEPSLPAEQAEPGTVTKPSDAELNGTESTTATESSDAASAEVHSYPLPSGNPYVASTYAQYCASSKGGMYLCSGQFLTYRSVDWNSYVTLCPQEGCKHNDQSCIAYMGGRLHNLVEYNGKLYAVVLTEDNHYQVIQKNLENYEIKVLGEQAAQEQTDTTVTNTEVWLMPPANGKLYYQIHQNEYDILTMELISQKTVVVCYNVESGTTNELPISNFCISGKAGFVVPVREGYFDTEAEAFVTTCYELRLYDATCSSYQVIAENNADGYVTTPDPNSHYGNLFCYLCRNTLYTLDADTGTVTELLTAENQIVNFWLMDHKIFYITNNDAGEAYFFYAGLDDLVPVQLKNGGNTSSMVFSMSYEGNDFFAADRKVLSKADFYAEKYD